MDRKIFIDPQNVMTSIDENWKALKDGIDPTKLSQAEKEALCNDLDDLEKVGQLVKEVLKQSE